MSWIVIALLVVIAVELGVVIYLIGGGGGLPWMLHPEDGLLAGKVASPLHHRTLNAKIEYLMCASRFQTELEDQRFRALQGLDPAPEGTFNLEATPEEVKG